jgi:hypothetical protein
MSPQSASAPVGDAALDFAILDAGGRVIAAAQVARAIRAIAANEAVAFESGRNSTCFAVRLDVGEGETERVAVKVPRLGPQRTNDDATFAVESAVLAGLPEAGIANAPKLLARVAAKAGHFLFITWLPGAHPDPTDRPLEARHLETILASLTAMDRRGLQHYDLKATNILVDGGTVGFVDFEFARFEGCLNAFDPRRTAFCEDYNVSGNPHFPARTNVANFEFRTLYRYCADLAAGQSPAVSEAYFCQYLQLRAEHHARMAEFFAELERTSSDAMAACGGFDASEARRRLGNATAHEQMVARLLLRPDARVVQIEWSLLALRHDMFEHPGEDVLRRLRDFLDELRRDATITRGVPVAFLEAAARTAELIGRSRR